MPSSSGTKQDSPVQQQTKRGITPPPFYVRINRISCDPCRKRKLKCDRVMPCATCKRRGIENQCYQDDRENQEASSSTLKRTKIGTPGQREGGGAEGDANGDFEDGPSLASNLAKFREQLNSISRMAKRSTQSLDSMLSSLPNGETKHGSETQPQAPPTGPVVLRDDGMVIWKDVCDYLPPLEKCEELIGFYFEELSVYIRITQRSLFDKNWRRLIDGPGIERIEASIIFIAFALADVMIPSSSSITRHSREDHHRWLMLLGDPISTPSASPNATVDNSFKKIQLLALTSIYHMYTGRTDRLWECIGIAMRKAIVFGLFDERKKSWAGLDNLTKEYRRRLAWYMLSLERWQAVVRQLPFALHPSYVYLAEASFEPDSRVMRNNQPAPIIPNTPAILPDGRLQTHISARRPGAVKFVLVELLAWCQEYLDQFASMEPSTRYSRALLLDDVLERILLDGLYNTGIERHELRYLSTSILDECVKERQVEVNLWVSSLFFLRCIITRRFLMDENAPPNLRFVSLMYAQGILATIPSLTRLIKEGQTPVQTTWNANHLLAAATTFTVVILGQDYYVESQAHPLDVEGTSSPADKSKGSFPTEQMDWLADNIFTTLDCLETLVRRGNHSAVVAKQLLERLCGTQSDLRTMYRVRFHKIAEGEQQQQQQQQQQYMNHHHHPDWEVLRQPGNSTHKQPDRSNYHSTVMLSSPSATSSATPASNSADIPSTGLSSNIPFVPPMSASSLLDAVLNDPTELDFLGNSNHSDLLAYLLQDSPTM